MDSSRQSIYSYETTYVKVCDAKNSTNMDGNKGAGVSNTQKLPDGGYGWVVMVCALILQGIACGISFSVGVFFTEWLSIFGQPHDVTAWVGSLNTGLMFAFGPVASVLVKGIGHRAVCFSGGIISAFGLLLASNATKIWHLYITYGVLGGIGVCFMYVPAAVVCSTYFDKYRPLALGVSSSGVGLFCLIIPHFLRLAIAHYGWRSAMIFMSALCVQSCLFSYLLIPLEFWQQKKTEENIIVISEDRSLLALHKEAKSTLYETVYEKVVQFLTSIFDLSLLGDIKFVIFFISNILWNIGSLIILVMINDYAVNVNMTKSNGTWLVSIIGLCGLVGRTGVGFINNLPCVNRFWIYNFATLLTAVAIGAVPIIQTFTSFALFCSLYGTFFGAQVGSLAVTTTDLYGLHKLPMAYGYIMVAHGIGALLGPPIGGLLYEATHGYEAPFYFGGAISCLAFALACVIPCLNRNSKSLRYTSTDIQIEVTDD